MFTRQRHDRSQAANTIHRCKGNQDILLRSRTTSLWERALVLAHDLLQHTSIAMFTCSPGHRVSEACPHLAGLVSIQVRLAHLVRALWRSQHFSCSCPPTEPRPGTFAEAVSTLSQRRRFRDWLFWL
jgi:hypothetical protein